MSPSQQYSQSVLLGPPPTSPPRLVNTVLAAPHHAAVAGVPYAQCSQRFACGASLCHFSCAVPPLRFRLAAVATTACGVLISWGGRLRFQNGEGLASMCPLRFSPGGGAANIASRLKWYTRASATRLLAPARPYNSLVFSSKEGSRWHTGSLLLLHVACRLFPKPLELRRFSVGAW